MIKLDVKGHNDMCGGYAYSGTALFEGKTVKEVLDEIREFSKDAQASYLGDGFGNPNSNGTDAWQIAINGVIYWTSWIVQKWDNVAIYTKDMDNLEVKEIKVNGGWYCFYDFDIITK